MKSFLIAICLFFVMLAGPSYGGACGKRGCKNGACVKPSCSCRQCGKSHNVSKTRHNRCNSFFCR